MKRSQRIALILALALAVSTASAFATEDSVRVNFNKINIEVDGGLKAVTGEFFTRLKDGKEEPVPYSILYAKTTYLPMVKVCEFIGKDISWDDNTRTVFIGNLAEPADSAPDSTAEPSAYQEIDIPQRSITFNSLNIVAYGQTFARPGTEFDRGGGEVVPYSILYNGTTFLPLAAVCQIVGKDISFDSETFTAIVKDHEVLECYPDTEVADYGYLCNLPKSDDSDWDDIMVYNYYNYTDTVREGKEAEDLQRYVSYLFDAGFTFSLDDSRKLIGDNTTTLYAYKNAETGRVAVIGLVQSEGLSEVVISYSK